MPHIFFSLMGLYIHLNPYRKLPAQSQDNLEHFGRILGVVCVFSAGKTDFDN
jgi:hypothetical protein